MNLETHRLAMRQLKTRASVVLHDSGRGVMTVDSETEAESIVSEHLVWL